MTALDPRVEPALRLPRPLLWIYEALLAVLAVTVAVLLGFNDGGVVRTLNLVIWALFGVDYVVRFALASERRAFVRRNVPDLIAIVPLDFLRIARLARLGRLVRLLRTASVLWRVTRNARGVLATNSLGWVLVFSTAVVVFGGLIASWAEPGFASFGDALWWAMVTATTVGYGDLSPVSGAGRATAAVLMLVGIGTLGMITGSIATYFISGRRNDANPQVAWIKEHLDQWDELDRPERRRIAAMLAGLADAE